LGEKKEQANRAAVIEKRGKRGKEVVQLEGGKVGHTIQLVHGIKGAAQWKLVFPEKQKGEGGGGRLLFLLLQEDKGGNSCGVEMVECIRVLSSSNSGKKGKEKGSRGIVHEGGRVPLADR